MTKKRSMTDAEVGLARAMLAKGMKNDQVHFYFNRVDRLISSGRIAQIKDGSYAKDVAPASDDELAAFTTKWDADHAAIYPKGPQSPTDVEFIEALFEKRKSSWHRPERRNRHSRMQNKLCSQRQSSESDRWLSKQ